MSEYESLAEWPADTGEWGSPLKAKRIIPITTAQYPTPAGRPLNSVLSNAKLQATFALQLPDWRAQLQLALRMRYADALLLCGKKEKQGGRLAALLHPITSRPLLH